MRRTFKYTDARKIARLQLGNPSDHFRKFCVKRGDKFVIWCRVSGDNQARDGNPEEQAMWLREAIESRGGIVVACIIHVGTGKLHRDDFDPNPLAKAVHLAKMNGATLLAESAERFVRNSFYAPIRKRLDRPTADDLESLIFWTGDTPLMTFVSPDASLEVVREHETKRGQHFKDKGGRPPKIEPGSKKRRRIKNLARVLRLRGKGWGYGRIARKCGLPRSTVVDWTKR